MVPEWLWIRERAVFESVDVVCLRPILAAIDRLGIEQHSEAVRIYGHPDLLDLFHATGSQVARTGPGLREPGFLVNDVVWIPRRDMAKTVVVVTAPKWDPVAGMGAEEWAQEDGA